MWRRVTQIAVSAPNTAAHQHHALELSKRRCVLVDGRAYIHQWANRDQRDLARMLPDLLQQKRHRIRMRRLRKMSALAVALLVHLRLRGRDDRDLRMPSLAQQPIHDPGARLGVAEV